MSLKGNLESVDLANVLQMLSMNQKEGTLRLFDGDTRKAIYFSTEGVSMISRGRRGTDTLGRILMRYGKTTEAQIEEALAKQKEMGKRLGEVLVAIGAVTEEDIENAVRTQIEEEIYNLFIWKEAEFEFREGPPPPALQNVPIRVTFNVNSLIVEAQRRADEWNQICTYVPSVDEIYRPTDTFKQANVDDEVFHFPFSPKVLEVLEQGRLDVSEIMDVSHAGKFEVSKILSILLEQHALEPVSLADLQNMANEAVQAGDQPRAAKFFQRIVDLGGATPAVNMQLGYALEALERREKAANCFKAAAESYSESGQPAHAYGAYARVVQGLPSDLPAAHRLVELACDHAEVMEANRPEVVETGRVLAECRRALGSLPAALKLLHRLAKANPQDMPLRNMLATLYVDSGMSDEAASELESMANVAAAEKRFDEAVRYLRRVTTIDRSRKDVLKKIEALTSERDKTRRLVLRIVGVAVFLGIAATLYWAVQRVSTQRDQQIEKINDLVDSTLEPGLERFDAARASMEASLEELEGWTDLETARVGDLADSMAEAWTGMEKAVAETQAEVNRLYDEHGDLLTPEFREVRTRTTRRRLEGLETDRDRLFRKIADDGSRLLEKGRRTAERDGRPFSAIPDVERAAALLAIAGREEDEEIEEASAYLEQLRTYEKQVDDVQEQAADLREQGKMEDAHNLLCDFLGTYQSEEFNEVVLLHLRVGTVPEGASVRVKRGVGADAGPVSAPVELRYSIAEGLLVEVFSDGFSTREFDIPAVGERYSPESLKQRFSWEAKVVLDKVPLWSAEVGQGGVDAVPVAAPDGSFVLIGARNGRLYRVEANGGAVRSYDVRSPSGFQASPVLVGARVCVASVDARIAALDLGDFSEAWWKDESAGLGQVYGTPIVVDDLLVVAGAGGTVRAYRVANGSMAWQVKLDWGVRRPLLYLRGRIVAFCVDGRLRAIEPDGSDTFEVTTAPGGSRPAVPAGPAIAAGNKVLTLHQGREVQVALVELPAEGSHPDGGVHDGFAKDFATPDSVPTGIAFQQYRGVDELYQLLRSGMLRIVDTQTAKAVGPETPVVPIVEDGDQEIPLGAPAVADDGVYVVTARAVRAFRRDARGRVEAVWAWNCPEGDALTTEPVVVGPLVLVCTRNGRVHVLRRD